MKSPLSPIPWNTSALWQEANDAIRYILKRRGDAMAEPRRLAENIQRQLAAVFPLMDRLCRTACPGCTDICCHRAWVWADDRDLLFLHLAGIPIPEAQLRTGRGDRCRYITPEGCRLDRMQRPFVCTWYLCPAQTEQLRKNPVEMQKTTNALVRIKNLRKEMERIFIRMTARHPGPGRHIPGLKIPNAAGTRSHRSK